MKVPFSESIQISAHWIRRPQPQFRWLTYSTYNSSELLLSRWTKDSLYIPYPVDLVIYDLCLGAFLTIALQASRSAGYLPECRSPKSVEVSNYYHMLGSVMNSVHCTYLTLQCTSCARCKSLKSFNLSMWSSKWTPCSLTTLISSHRTLPSGFEAQVSPSSYQPSLGSNVTDHFVNQITRHAWNGAFKFHHGI